MPGYLLPHTEDELTVAQPTATEEYANRCAARDEPPVSPAATPGGPVPRYVGDAGHPGPHWDADGNRWTGTAPADAAVTR